MRWMLLTWAVVAWPVMASGLTCPPPPAFEVLYPRPGETVPRDALVFISRRGTREPHLALVERGSGQKCWLRVKRAPGLLTLSPAKLLRANTVYELRQPGALKSKPAVVLLVFRTSGRVCRRGPGMIRRAELGFSPGGKASMGRRAGRAAVLALHADPAPAVVGIELAFRKRGRKAWSATWHLGLAYAASLAVASTRACDSTRPAAPTAGRYRLVLVPYSPTGERGRALQLEGVIK
jgi:hypothetical protein